MPPFTPLGEQMYIEITIPCLSTEQGPYRGGEIYELPDADALRWINQGIAKPSAQPPHHVIEFYGRLDMGAGKPTLFLPSVAEFGHRILTGYRIVHWHKASRKVVCCRPGEEVLYPSADQFELNWTDPVDDAKRGGTGPALRWPEIEARYPGYTCIQTGNLSPEQEKLCINPEQRIPFRPKLRGLKADVCLGVRHRAFCREKNWPGWQLVADALTANGYTFAVIGSRPTTMDLKGQTHTSADYDTDASGGAKLLGFSRCESACG
jgi:hypothetical protein